MPKKPENSRIRKMQGHQGLNKKKKQKVESNDLISQLPDHIIHHILSFLRSAKEVARISILSKRWREIWHSFSSLTFDERAFVAGFKDKDNESRKCLFLNYVHNSLSLYRGKNMGVEKLIMRLISYDKEDDDHLDYWLSLITEKNIKELDINIGTKRCSNRSISRYIAPESIFLTKSLTRLRLCGCELIGYNNIMLPRLQKLCLRNIQLNECIIQNMISSCISIEDLRLIQCSGLKKLQIYSCVQLNKVEIHHCKQLKMVAIDCANLHTFWFQCQKSARCKVNLAGCQSLKRLTLGYRQVKNDFCEKSQFHNFPHLEILDLSALDDFRSINISNPQLQRLVLRGCRGMVFVSINTPNLLSFEFQGQKMPFIYIHDCNLRNAKLSFVPKYKVVPKFNKQVYFPKLRGFIEQFSEDFKLVVRSKKNIVIHENVKQVLFPELPNLNIDIIASSVFLDLLNSLLQTCRPETLCIISPKGSEFPELVCKKMKNKENPSCCKYIVPSNKCWRHFLKYTKSEDFGDAENEWTSTWLHWLQSERTTLSSDLTDTNVRLYWNTNLRPLDGNVSEGV